MLKRKGEQTMNRLMLILMCTGLLWGCNDTPNQPSEPEENTGQTVNANNVFADGGPIPAPPLPGGALGAPGPIGNPIPQTPPVTVANPAPLPPVNTAPITPPANTTPVAPPPPPQTIPAPIPGAPLPVAPPVGEPAIPAPGTGFGYTSGNSQEEG